MGDAEDFDFTTPILRDARDRGRHEMVERLLRGLLVRRVGRTLTDPEQQALTALTLAGNPEETQDRALSLEGEALVAWLLGTAGK